MRLNTDIPGTVVITSAEADATGSPRTKVAYNFQGLQLEDGGTVSKLDLQRSNAPVLKPKEESAMEESAVRKRMKVFGGQEKSGRTISGGSREIPETPDKRAFSIVFGPERRVDPIVAEKARGVVLHNEVDPVIFKGTAVGEVKDAGSGLGRAYPSINRLSDSQSRASAKPKKRSGTPPLFGTAEASLETDDGERRVVDEERAALTWHDEEITGHNPDDPDDDGEGINGIGFKPTPAMAYARTEKRRQQMLEYKNREAREARAKRSERRRASEVSKSSREEEETARRVRFLEGEVKNIISTS